MTELPSLVKAAQDGDKDAFGQVVRRFQDMAYASAYATVGDACLAQDIAQEAFLDAYLNLSKLRDPAAFPGWFRRIVLGHSNRQRRHQPVTIVPLEDAGSLYTPLPDPALSLEEMQLRQEVHSVIDRLPQSQRLVTVLFYVEGYSQQEIADYLELPVSTVKKRLFDARQNFKGRMMHMVQEHLQHTKPSQNDHFANAVQFFTAVIDGDCRHAGKIVHKDPAVLQAKTEWQMAQKRHYWPLGSTALHLATDRGDATMVTWLLSQGADVNASNPYGMTPLHVAVIMRRLELARLLLENGAAVNAQTAVHQTPLHHAVLRKNAEMARLLLEHGAALNLADDTGRTPVDWVALKRSTPLVDVLGQHGVHWPRPDTIPDQPTTEPPAILVTGIKVIDLLAPLKRGGRVGFFTPRLGVGFTVVLGQLIRSLSELHQGYAVSIGLESAEQDAESLQLFWREAGVDEELTCLYGKMTDAVAKRRQAAAAGVAQAEQMRKQGKDVLLLVDSQLALTEGVLPYLSTKTVATPGASLTLLLHGHYTVGAEPEPLTDLDTVITFDAALSRQRLYPAIDPLWSSATLLGTDQVEPQHRQVAQQVRRLLRRYADLHDEYEKSGVNAFWYIKDDPSLSHDLTRARRVQRFLTQPFSVAEPWTGTMGQYVPLTETMRGCQAILAGQYDHLPEEAFYFVGTLDQAIAKAKHK
jgi:RNA polymerase sigma factor (sigma-70 family)